MQRIRANIWFNDQAEEAAQFYTSILPDGRVDTVSYYGEAGKEYHKQKPGSVMTVDFSLGGHGFTALNGGPMFRPNPSISFFVNCTQAAEVDRCWNALAPAGKVLMPLDSYPFSKRYGWVEDKFGVSWQLFLSEGPVSQRIMPCLLFVGERCGRAEEAMKFYADVFQDSRIAAASRYGEGNAPNEPNNLNYGEVVLRDYHLVVMDSALDHQFGFTEGVSLIIDCEDQAGVDHYWERLSAVPEAEACGWLKDRFGVSWQVAPSEFYELVGDGSSEVAQRVMSAMMPMKKLDIDALRRAAGAR